VNPCRPPAVALAFVVVALSAAVVAGSAARPAVLETGPSRLTTSALGDVTVRRGRTATFRYSVHGTGAAGSDVELRFGSAATGVVMTVHLGRHLSGTALSQPLTIDLAPGSYVWAVAATDARGEVSWTASVAILRVTENGSHKVQ
jgi:hypothetical protein